MNFEIVSYGGWDRCYKLSNEYYELIVTAEVGARIIHFSRVDGDNILKQIDSQMGQIGSDEFKLYGGHRLWHAPEQKPRTYQPDNEPVEHFELNQVHYFVPPVETATGIQKQMSIRMQGDAIRIDHALTNFGIWDVTLAPWAITMLATGGTAIVPLPPYGSHSENLLPTHALTLWAYTKLNDPRFQFGEQYIAIHQDETTQNPLKIGLRILPEWIWAVGWLAYIRDGLMFVKSYHPDDMTLQYPDLESQIEVYTNADVLELETLGGLVSLGAGETVTHREYWSLHNDVPTLDDTSFGQDIVPMIRNTHPTIGRRNPFDA